MNALKELTNKNCISKSCKFNCLNYITENRVIEIKNYFKSLGKNSENQKNFILFNVKRELRKIKYMYKYKLDNICVCKDFFHKTLDININTKFVQKFFDSNILIDYKHWKSHSGEFNKSIEDFFYDNYKPENSHYKYSSCPDRKYISDFYQMDYIKLYKEFAKFKHFEPRIFNNEISINNKAGVALNLCNYRYFFKYVSKKLNIAISPQSDDKCFVCYNYNLHNKESDKCHCKECESYESHRQTARIAKNFMKEDEKNRELSTDTKVFA